MEVCHVTYQTKGCGDGFSFVYTVFGFNVFTFFPYFSLFEKNIFDLGCNISNESACQGYQHRTFILYIRVI